MIDGKVEKPSVNIQKQLGYDNKPTLKILSHPLYSIEQDLRDGQ